MARLLKTSGEDEVLSRGQILFEACKRRVWPGKSGMADFTIGRLSSFWNSLIVDAYKSKGDVALEEALRRAREKDMREGQGEQRKDQQSSKVFAGN